MNKLWTIVEEIQLWILLLFMWGWAILNNIVNGPNMSQFMLSGGLFIFSYFICRILFNIFVERNVKK